MYWGGGNKYQNWTLKFNFLRQKLSEIKKKEFIEEYEFMSTFFDNFNL